MQVEPKFKNYKEKQKYYKELSQKQTVFHESTKIIKDKMGRVIGRTPGITYRKDDKDGN